MRLTLDMVRRAPQFTNTLRQREIDLRGLGLTVLDERPLLMLNDSFDVLNLSQNPLARLDYFPGSGPALKGGLERSRRMLTRLQSLVVHRNRLFHVSESACAAVLPNLRAFLADHNEFRELRDLLFLSKWPHLEILSIEHNPVTLNENGARLRAFVVFLCPKLKLVNYQRVTMVDRSNVEAMRAEFAQLVNEWRLRDTEKEKNAISNNGSSVMGTASEIDSGSLPNERKVRKRGREARSAAAAKEKNNANNLHSGATAVADDIPSSLLHATDTLYVEHGEVDTTQARLDALEAKMAAAETEEELLEIQQEIMELEEAAKRQQAAKSRRLK